MALDLPVQIGTMIEVPRAALTADRIAASADFFSFGTNDLTQLTWGFSRDDVEAAFFPTYLDHGILPVSPFESIDVDGVGALVPRPPGWAGRPGPTCTWACAVSTAATRSRSTSSSGPASTTSRARRSASPWPASRQPGPDSSDPAKERSSMNATSRNTFQGGAVRLEPLNRYDCWQLVTEAAGPDGIARVVWSGPDGPAIVPVNYTVADGFLWFQTTPDSRLARECCDQQVLVEVDQVDPASHTGWSVVVTGRGDVPAFGGRSGSPGQPRGLAERTPPGPAEGRAGRAHRAPAAAKA